MQSPCQLCRMVEQDKYLLDHADICWITLIFAGSLMKQSMVMQPHQMLALSFRGRGCVHLPASQKTGEVFLLRLHGYFPEHLPHICSYGHRVSSEDSDESRNVRKE